MTIGNGGASRVVAFAESIQTATAGQAVFNAGFDVQRVFVDSVLYTTGYTGQGTGIITFDVALDEGREVYLTT